MVNSFGAGAAMGFNSLTSETPIFQMYADNGGAFDLPFLQATSLGVVSLGATGTIVTITKLLTTDSVVASTAGSGAPNVLTAALSGQVTTNEGASAENYNTLPAAAAGLKFSFYCQDSDGIRIKAGSGDTIRIETSASGAAGFIRSVIVGSCITLEAVNATEWVATSKPAGTWTIDI